MKEINIDIKKIEEESKKSNYAGYLMFKYGIQLFIFLFLFTVTTTLSLVFNKVLVVDSLFVIFPSILLLCGIVIILVFPYILYEMILIERFMVMYNLNFHLFIRKNSDKEVTKKEFKSVSDNLIFKYLKRYYSKYLIIVSNVITIFIYDENNKFTKDISYKIVSSIMNEGIEEMTLLLSYVTAYIIPFVIIYIILKVVLLNKNSLRNTKSFNKYREMFEYKEVDYKEEFFFKMKRSNTIVFYICLILYNLFFARYIKLNFYLDLAIFLCIYFPLSRYFYLKISKKYEIYEDSTYKK